MVFDQVLTDCRLSMRRKVLLGPRRNLPGSQGRICGHVSHLHQSLFAEGLPFVGDLVYMATYLRMAGHVTGRSWNFTPMQ